MENTVETSQAAKVASTEPNETPMYSARKRGEKRALSLIDFVLRFIAAGGTLGSAVSMGTTDQVQTFFAQFVQVRAEAKYDDLPTFRFFVIANSIACGYLLLSLPLSIFHVIKPRARKSRIALLIFDMVMLALVTAGASSATAIVYLAHEGNSSANWNAICQQFDSFCTRISGSLIGSFGAVIVFMLLVVTTALAISRG